MVGRQPYLRHHYLHQELLTDEVTIIGAQSSSIHQIIFVFAASKRHHEVAATRCSPVNRGEPAEKFLVLRPALRIPKSQECALDANDS